MSRGINKATALRLIILIINSISPVLKPQRSQVRGSNSDIRSQLNQFVPRNGTVIVMEIAHYLIKNLGPIRGKEKVEKLLQSDLVIHDFSHSNMILAVNKLAEFSHTGVGGRDSTVLSTMEEFGIKRLITHDKSFIKVDTIIVEDPIL